jgi:phosphocarrier protein FPr
MLESLDDAALRARVHDLRDVELRLSTCLSAPTAERREDASFEMPTILVAAALFPSELAALDRTAVRGLCLTDVGIDSHTAILARALQIPAIAVDAASRAGLTDGANAWLDGSGGRLVIEPHADEMAAAEDERMPVAEFVGAAPVRITAAAASAAEAAFACASGAAGIGLLRTEFLFAAHTAPPRVDEHAAAIRAVAEACPGRTVTVRLLDAGGDKPLGFVGHSREPNPALGMRGARVLVANPDLVRAQAAGIAAVAREGRSVRVSIPMVVDVPEALQVRAVLDEAFDDLPADLRPKIGVMIEVPAAAILADEFAAAFDFLSIGSSDLAQYVLAADRADGRYRAYGGASHAAVQRCIEGVVRAARRQGRPISLCGDAVGNPEAVRAFIAFGGDELVAPADRLAAVRAAAGG